MVFQKGNTHKFKDGNVPYNKKRKAVKQNKSDSYTSKYIRLTKEKHNLVVNDPYANPQEKSKRACRAARLLRPMTEEVLLTKPIRKNAKKDKRPDYNSNRAICIYKMEEMWNAAFKEHQLSNPQCGGVLLCDLENEEKRGFGTRQQLICTKCDYKSKRYTLYEELETRKPGRKASKLDTAIHVGLSQTPIAYTGIQKIFLSGNILAPTTSSLQRRANTVMKQIEQINKQDMKRRRNDIIEINKLRGKENPHAISVQMDGMYNNPLYSGVGRTPFQPATQTVYTAAENETSKHNILALNIKNKLCSKHSSLDVDNDSGRLHEDCTDECSANIPMVKSIGDEYTWARECLLDLKEDAIEIEHLVTDADSSAYKAALDLHNEGINNVEPENFLDTRHLSDHVRKGAKSDKTLLKVMPATTKLKRQKLLNNFSVDLTERCNKELALAYKFYAGDFFKVKNKISHTVDAIANCYMGNHARCRKNSFACKGFQGSWLKGRPFLQNTFKISSNNENLDLLRKQINKRLGSKVLDKTRLNMNTNFVEGFNRSLRRSLPSNVTFKKNMSGRAHAAAHSVNYGPGGVYIRTL
ncbi:unnamed protein product [Mytilus coruscus]|uniref:Mutator-like transposase domain-containing protein n=1 Tax=Mytilus coruscus TaxID=42192 RepID=A0A6J8ANF2_MYTCO|nr:unnamed protein product [Mytilus coruscus]